MPTGEALQALLRELRTRFGPDADPREVEIWLAAMGYDVRQIAEIRRALAGAAPASTAEVAEPEPDVSGMAQSPPVTQDEPAWPPLRVAAPYERARFSPAAWGQLLQLRAAGLDGVEFEQLVDRAMLQIDGRIGLDDLRTLMEGGAGEDPGPVTGTVH